MKKEENKKAGIAGKAVTENAGKKLTASDIQMDVQSNVKGTKSAGHVKYPAQ